jgi:DNA-binding NtrC family response regulator
MTTEEKCTILIIDDDVGLQRAWGKFLRKYTITHAYTITQGLDLFRQDEPDIILLDVVLPDGNGLDLLIKLHQVNPTIPIIVVTGQFDMHIAAKAVKAGAYDFLAKPVNTERLRVTVTRAIEASLLANEVNRLRIEFTLGDTLGLNKLVIKSKGMSDVVSRLHAVAPRNTTVLLLGPSGVGKSVLARMLHKISTRNSQPFVEVNMTTMNEGTLESQLFGHIKGSFTGAISNSDGFFKAAQNGTIFLDEIGDMPLSTQVKLLQVIQDRIIYPVGSSKPQHIDVRIVAATIHDMENLVAMGRFREDLYYRLNVFPIKVPSLSQRREEVPALVQHFINRVCRKEKIQYKTSSIGFLQMMLEYEWPGNIRELENAVEYAITVSKDRLELLESDLEGFHPHFSSNNDLDTLGSNRTPSGSYFDAIPDIGPDFNLDTHLDEMAIKIINFSLARENGNISKTSALLGISRRRLTLMMKKLNIQNKTKPGRPLNSPV